MSEFDIPPKSIRDDMPALERWMHDRLGKFTASNAWRGIKKLKSGAWAAERTAYKIELIAERLTGMRQDVFINAAMMHGLETQGDAERAYEAATGNRTREVWFVSHPTLLMAGASPDRLVGDDGLLEIKCPLTKTHIETMLAKEIPEKHLPQLIWQLACTGRQWVDFVSFDPRLPKELRLYINRLYRDDAAIAGMEESVAEFLAELDSDIGILGACTPLPSKDGDGRKEAETTVGYSDSLPAETFSGIESLINAGLLKKGV